MSDKIWLSLSIDLQKIMRFLWAEIAEHNFHSCVVLMESSLFLAELMTFSYSDDGCNMYESSSLMDDHQEDWAQEAFVSDEMLTMPGSSQQSCNSLKSSTHSRAAYYPSKCLQQNAILDTKLKEEMAGKKASNRKYIAMQVLWAKLKIVFLFIDYNTDWLYCRFIIVIAITLSLSLSLLIVNCTLLLLLLLFSAVHSYDFYHIHFTSFSSYNGINWTRTWPASSKAS